jgi:hypothetical protein
MDGMDYDGMDYNELRRMADGQCDSYANANGLFNWLDRRPWLRGATTFAFRDQFAMRAPGTMGRVRSAAPQRVSTDLPSTRILA